MKERNMRKRWREYDKIKEQHPKFEEENREKEKEKKEGVE